MSDEGKGPYSGFWYPDRDDREWKVRYWRDCCGWTWEAVDQYGGLLFNSGSSPRHHRSLAKAEREFAQAVRAARMMRVHLAAAERAKARAEWR